MTSKMTLYGLAILLVCAGCSSSDPGDGARPGGGGGGAGGGGGGDGGGGAGGAGPGASDELCGERPGGSFYAAHVLRFEASDGQIVIQLRRTWEEAGVGESSLFRLDGFSVLLDGEATCVTEPNKLEYVNTHHNWTDVARADAGEERYELAMNLGAPATLSAFAADGTVLVDAAPLIATGSPAFCPACPTPMPVSISEVMLDNTTTLADDAGEHEPWIELFNPSSGDVDLTGWTLSDDFTERGKWPLPPVTLPRHGLLVLFADGDTDQGELHTSFALDPSGGELVLTAADGSSDGGLVLGAQAPDVSLAYQWTAGDYVIGQPTPGEPPAED
ncbi:lamin tail domain-containing protein [Sorangium sp. So ce296]|uniref:lamin tail domain-containing protein n=1 Tax=Sorangium sp. So ce296 TaxID=3133296 RepID=UPI003F62E333